MPTCYFLSWCSYPQAVQSCCTCLSGSHGQSPLLFFAYKDWMASTQSPYDDISLCFFPRVSMSACCSPELFLSSCSDLSIPISCASAREALSIPVFSVSLLHIETSPTASCQYPQCLWIGLPVLLWQNKIRWSSWNHYDSAVLLSVYPILVLPITFRYLPTEKQCRAKSWLLKIMRNSPVSEQERLVWVHWRGLCFTHGILHLLWSISMSFVIFCTLQSFRVHQHHCPQNTHSHCRVLQANPSGPLDHNVQFINSSNLLIFYFWLI